MNEWQSLTTRSGNRPGFRGRARGRSQGSRKVFPRTKKDMQQDQQIKSLKSKIKKVENEVDLGHKDSYGTVVAVSDPGVAQVILLNGLVQGTTDITRLKDLVNWTSIQMKGRILLNINNTLGSVARILIVMDRQSNGVALTAAQVLDYSVITQPIFAPYNDDYFPRFKILYDQKFVLNPQMVLTTVTGGTTQVSTFALEFDLRRKLNPSKKNQTNYGLGNTGTITDISSNAIYLILLSDETVASTTGPAVEYGVRLYYKDA